ncbi:unnamed protein product [Heterobilharzia americana]|nr:unnamed protein product [Heterobilharzia americana]
MEKKEVTMNKLTYYTSNISLKNLLFSTLYLSISGLKILDSFYQICENQQSIMEYNSNPYREVKIDFISSYNDNNNNSNNNNNVFTNHKILMINHLKCEQHTLITYCTEIFGSLLNIISASLYFITSLYSLLIYNYYLNDKKILSNSRIPFPSYYTNSDDRIDISYGYYKFSSLLANIAGLFGCLMIMTTISLRIYKLFILNIDENLLISLNLNIKEWLIDTTVEKIQHIGLIVLIFKLLIINIYGLCISKDLIFCSQLTRLTSLLSSILIIFGGITILGSVLQSIEISYITLYDSIFIRLKAREIFYFLSGTLNIFTGLLSILTLQYCSIPLVNVLKRIKTLQEPYNLKILKYFNRPTHLFVLISCFISIPLQLNVFIMIKPNIFIIKIEQLNYLNNSMNSSLRLYHYGFTLNYFSSLFSLPLLSLLLCCTLIDLYVRKKFIFLSNIITSSNTLQVNNDKNVAIKSLENGMIHYSGTNHDIYHVKNNNLISPEIRISYSHYSKLSLENIQSIEENNTMNFESYPNKVNQYEEQQCVRYSDLEKFDKNWNRLIPQYTSDIQLTNSFNPVYLEHDSIQSKNITLKDLKIPRININPNYLNQIVYKCSIDTPQLTYHSYNNQLYPSESCEYMSCDLQQHYQQNYNSIKVIQPEINNFNSLTHSELIKLFTETKGEDFITSV